VITMPSREKGYTTERFFAKVAKQGGDGCWEWLGARDQDGYGRLYVDGKPARAHRWIWEQQNGALVRGLLVCHHCDNPPCVRLSHLFAGTSSDNSRDAVAKGRHVPPRASKPRAHCQHGHSLSGDNVIITSNGNGVSVRRCKTCRTAQMAKWQTTRPSRSPKRKIPATACQP
jgi:hypothetical protein